MRVYVAIRCRDEQDDPRKIIGVFSSEQSALAALDACAAEPDEEEGDYPDYFQIDAFDLDASPVRCAA